MLLIPVGIEPSTQTDTLVFTISYKQQTFCLINVINYSKGKLIICKTMVTSLLV